MTPNLKRIITLCPHGDYVFFDIGRLPQYSTDRLLNQSRLLHPPFPRCAVVGQDADGDTFALFVIGGESSVAVSGVTITNRGHLILEPFAYMETPDGLRLHRAGEITQARAAVSIIDEWLTRLDDGGKGYKPEPANHLRNRARKLEGKPPVVFIWHTLTIAPRRSEPEPQGGTHASPRAHDRRGHWRNHPTAGQVWVKHCRVGDLSLGAVEKVYSVVAQE